MGWINHGAYIIQLLRHVLIFLAYGSRILFAAHNGAEYISRHKESFLCQLIMGIAYELRNSLGLIASLGIRVVKNNIIHGLVHGKPDIVELNLVKSRFACLFPHLNQIIPDFLLIRIYPCKAFIIPVNLAVSHMQAPLRLLFCKIGVPERHHPGYGIDSMLLKLCHKRRHVLDKNLAGPYLIYRRGIHGIGDPSLVILHINDHCIELRPVDLLNDLIHHITGTGHIGGYIDALYLYRVSGRVCGNGNDLGISRLCLLGLLPVLGP